MDYVMQHILSECGCRSQILPVFPHLQLKNTMGKSQKKKAMRRHNPMRVPDNHLPPGLGPAAETSKKKDQIPPILQKVCSCAATGSVNS